MPLHQYITLRYFWNVQCQQFTSKQTLAMTDKMALYKSGMNKFVQQDFAGALDDLAQAIVLDPQFADAYQAMAHCHEKLGDLDQALSAAQKAAEHDPDDFLVHTSLSMFYQRKGMIAEAEREKAIAAKLQMENPL